MKKTCDCVDIKHKGAQKVQCRLATMALEEQVKYWQQRGREVEERRDRIAARSKAS
ncbi:MAG: hypothetical protein ABFD54_01855 [Armatimonadota bacterium]|nr:hypothetical protein [bacterium]